MAKEVILDVREDLNNKRDPFKKIMTTVKSLEKDQTLILHSTIKPTPLLTIMKAKGYGNEVEKLDKNHYKTVFTKRKGGIIASLFRKEKTTPNNNSDESLLKDNEKAAYFLDNRGLEPPQPMMRTMKRLETLEVNETLTIHNDRVPVFLLEELKQMDIDYSIEEIEDGSAKVHLTRV